MTVLAIDTESNTWNKGAPFDRRYKHVCTSYAYADCAGAVASGDELVRELVQQATVLVGFNLKYDLHVLRHQGIQPPEGCTIWDCQLGEFVRSVQTKRYPSLNEALSEFGLGQKIDVVSEEYWNKGIQTEDIPWEILSAYATEDARLTLELYHAQQKALSPTQQRLVRQQGQDLLVLEEMEWNGLKYDADLVDQRATEITQQIQEIERELSLVYPDIPINFNSGDDLSSFLYGGTIETETRTLVGFFKTGAKIGQPRYSVNRETFELPQLVKPLRGSELKKKGFYATNADTLLKLKGTRKTKHIIELIQKRTRLDSLMVKTYGYLSKVNTVQNWERGWLHGQFNQCVAATGRLSSSNPNLQNLDGGAADLFISRYND